MSMIGMFVQLNNEQFSRALNQPTLLEQLIDSAPEDQVLDVDKTWEALYYLLTGSALADDSGHPLGKVLFSYQYFDEDHDMGYGPAHYLTPEQVKEINSELSGVSGLDIRNRYDGEKMDEAGIYPEVWSDEESLELVARNFNDLKEFYRTAAERDYAMVMYIE